MRKFFKELLRRGIFKVAAIYIVAAWVIVQVAIAVGPALLLPDWIDTLVILLLGLGFPVAMILAWAQELSPDHKRPDSTDEITTAAELPRPPEQSIAVLPFVNMSEDPAQEFFSDGISEELLNGLAKIKTFRVAARTSSFRYKGRADTISEIGAALNVAHVLEGSVRKSGETIRITAQLIRADTGYHLWSETYDRNLEDIFAIQDEISAAIVKAMCLHVLGEEVDDALPVLALSRKIDTRAYEFFLKGRELVGKRGPKNVVEGRLNFEKALKIEPDYVPALAGLAEATLLQVTGPGSYGNLPVKLVQDKARDLLNRAIRLDPDAVEVHATLAQYYNMINDPGTALLHIDLAIRANPGFSSTFARQSFSRKFLGDPKLSPIESLRRALELDPTSNSSLYNLAFRTGDRLNDVAVASALDRIRQVDERRSVHNRVVADALLHKGQVVEALQAIREGMALDPSNKEDSAFADFGPEIRGILREPVQAPQVDQSVCLINFLGDRDKAAIIERCRVFSRIENNDFVGLPVQQVIVDGWGDDPTTARSTLENFFDADGWGPMFIDELVALVPALLVHLRRKDGEEAGAQQVIAKMTQVYEIECHHPDGPYMTNDLLGAAIATLQGNFDLAFERLEKQFDRVWYGLATLRADPVYEALHNDPRFEALNARLDERVEAERKRARELGLLPLEAWLDPPAEAAPAELSAAPKINPAPHQETL